MIYLTGDVHEKINGHWEQKISGSELDNTIKYLEILRKSKISCTLFINGILLDKNPKKIKEILKFNVELGGHTYNNFGNMDKIKSYIYRKIWGCIYGSASYQKRDIKKTKKAFEKLGLEMNSWRTHAFGSNKETFKILKKQGVKYVSDFLGKIKPFEKDGIIHLPINIPVDVVTVAYGVWKPENIDPFASCTKGRIEPEEWFEIVKKRIIENEKKGIDSFLLLHPTTMATLDNFKLFEKMTKFLSKYKDGKISGFKLKTESSSPP